MLGSFFLICSAAFGIFSLIQEISRKTPPCGLPRPALTSRMMQRATTSRDRKSTRLNSSHDQISYAVFCLKKKKRTTYSSHRGQQQKLDYHWSSMYHSD